MAKSVTFSENLVQTRIYTLDEGEKKGTRKASENLKKPKSITPECLIAEYEEKSLTVSPPLSDDILKKAKTFLKSKEGRSVKEASKYPKLKNFEIEMLRLFQEKDKGSYQAVWFLKNFNTPLRINFSKERIEHFSARQETKKTTTKP